MWKRTGENDSKREKEGEQVEENAPDELCPHAHACHGMYSEKLEPAIDDLGVCVPDLDDALVRPPLEIFLALLVDKRTLGYGPQRRPDGERGRSGEGNAKGVAGPEGKVGEKR